MHIWQKQCATVTVRMSLHLFTASENSATVANCAGKSWNGAKISVKHLSLGSPGLQQALAWQFLDRFQIVSEPEGPKLSANLHCEEAKPDKS